MASSQLDGSKIVTPEGIYENNLINHQDSKLASITTSGIRFDYSIGGYWAHRDFELGLSVHNLFLGDYNLDGAKIAQPDAMTIFFKYPVIILDQVFYPSFLLKTNF